MRNAIAHAQELIAQLQDAALEAIALESRIQELEGSSASEQGHQPSSPDQEQLALSVDAIDQFEISRLKISRLKLQRERKLATCVVLRAKLEAMNSMTLFCANEDELKQITRFAKLVRKKQVRIWFPITNNLVVSMVIN